MNYHQFTYSTYKKGIIYADLIFNKFVVANNPKKILDCGCGSGAYISSAISLTKAQIDGVDLDLHPELSRFDSVERVSLFEEDILKFGKNFSKKYDVILALNIIEHFNYEEGRDLIDILLSRLNLNGILIMQFPNMSVPNGISTFYSDNTHLHSYTKASFLQLSKTLKNKYSSIKVYNTPFVNNRIDRYLRYLISKFFRFSLMINLVCEKGISYINEPLSPNIIAVIKK